MNTVKAIVLKMNEHYLQYDLYLDIVSQLDSQFGRHRDVLLESEQNNSQHKIAFKRVKWKQLFWLNEIEFELIFKSCSWA